MEIVSPTERGRDTLDKVGEYLDAGTSMVWVIDPRRHHATIWDAAGGPRTVTADGELDGGAVFPASPAGSWT